MRMIMQLLPYGFSKLLPASSTNIPAHGIGGLAAGAGERDGTAAELGSRANLLSQERAGWRGPLHASMGLDIDGLKQQDYLISLVVAAAGPAHLSPNRDGWSRTRTPLVSDQ